MFKKEYYCLIAGFPDLFFGENKSVLTSVDFRNELEFQLNETDFNLVKLLFLPFDNKNLLNFLFDQKEPFNKLGNFPKNFLETDNEYPIELPSYMVQYLKWINKQDSKDRCLPFENKLYSLFYEYVLNVKNDFLNHWFSFELNIKNVLTAFNCNRFNYDLKTQLIPNKTNDTVYSLLLNKRLKHELFEDEIPFAEQIFRTAEADISMLEKEKSVDKIKWDYLDEATFFHYFTIEKILSFVIKLNLTERWLKLDAETGNELLNKLINELKTSYKFPVEFST